MHIQDNVLQPFGVAVSAATVTTGVVAEKVYFSDITLNEISICVGITVGVLTALLQAIKIYKEIRDRKGGL